jgi:hypothetical protein
MNGTWISHRIFLWGTDIEVSTNAWKPKYCAGPRGYQFSRLTLVLLYVVCYIGWLLSIIDPSKPGFVR